MDLSDRQQSLLRRLPAVDRLIELAKKEACFELIPSSVTTHAMRAVIETDRRRIREGVRLPDETELGPAAVMQRVKAAVRSAMQPNLRRVVNATGVVIHTNLGRSLLAPEAVENLSVVASRYSNLEYDLERGRRGSRSPR